MRSYITSSLFFVLSIACNLAGQHVTASSANPVSSQAIRGASNTAIQAPPPQQINNDTPPFSDFPLGQPASEWLP